MKQLFFSFFLFFFFFITAGNAFGQSNLEDSTIAAPIFGVDYTATFPAADLKNRYGYINNIGFTAGYKLKNNLYLGIIGSFGFGKNSKIPHEVMFKHLIDNAGTITDMNGDIAGVLTFARQYTLNAEAGYVFKKLGHNPNSGLWLKFGAGYTWNKIRVESNDQVIPLVEKEYKKGYDNLTSGINTSQFIGYLFMSGGGMLNFYTGLYFQQGYTFERRNSTYYLPDTPVSKSMRFDLTFGIKAGWIIPIYKKIARDYYYN